MLFEELVDVVFLDGWHSTLFFDWFFNSFFNLFLLIYRQFLHLSEIIFNERVEIHSTEVEETNNPPLDSEDSIEK
jgi:hypothetical protein